MPHTGLEETMHRFFDAFNRGDIDAVLALYEADAAMIPKPGEVAHGTMAIRASLAGFMGLKPVLTPGAAKFAVAGGIALYMVHWKLEGTAPDGSGVALAGTSTDVLRRQVDGRWLFVIDNPWGIALVG